MPFVGLVLQQPAGHLSRPGDGREPARGGTPGMGCNPM